MLEYLLINRESPNFLQFSWNIIFFLVHERNTRVDDGCGIRNVVLQIWLDRRILHKNCYEIVVMIKKNVVKEGNIEDLNNAIFKIFWAYQNLDQL